MLGISEFFVALVVFLLIVQFLKLQWAGRRLPSGPTPLPFIGNLWLLGFKLHLETLEKLAQIHGNIFTLWLGESPVIVLHGFQAVKDGLTTNSEDVSGRPTTPFFDENGNKEGIVMTSGHTWKQQRRFGLMTLRNLGLGKKGLEHRIQEEAHHLVEYLMSERGQPLDPTVSFSQALSNVICAMVLGRRFSTDDETLQQLLKANACLLRPSGILSRRCKDDPTTTFDEGNLIHTILDFFIAGTESTATTLRWALISLVLHPDVQEKVQKELDSVLGPSQLICYEDRKNLPYTNAVIHEIQRYNCIAPIGVPRQCVKDTTLLGFPVPKGTVILPNICSVLSDPEQWETPHQFNPTHFLDKDGNFMSREAFLPFSAGHRVCLGERLARTELFIFFTNLLRAFTFRLPEGVTEINTERILGNLLQPHHYKICAVPR
ncbi:cytochrome P450 2J2-like isoform X2 [Malaclemys terrapin pileata]|uniref:cytochrome P450 2J2-like isoform X2 n=1 Tax=Malaclemys terrapin pileata TaxID=2991368 RepID=UPI0023A7A7CB|nr:cytochrome P450 2J2-like isoform X2 [Malaclemys terrapin pileata]